jgi:hypothetical protein
VLLREVETLQDERGVVSTESPDDAAVCARDLVDAIRVPG